MNIEEAAIILCQHRNLDPSAWSWGVDFSGYDRKYTNLEVAMRELSELRFKLTLLGVVVP